MHSERWASNVFRKEREQYFEIQDLKAQLQEKNIAISELKKLIKKGKAKSMDTKFDKPSVVRQPNAQRIPKPSVLEVNHNTNVSRPQRKRNQLKDKVMPNNSQVKLKKTQVEVHPRIPSVSNKMKSVTTCKDCLNSKNLNANDVCATCNKCLVDSNHFTYVTKMLNDVNVRTKKPNFAPILGYGDLVQGNVTINMVYYVEGLNHNLFSAGQFCDADLEVAFRKSTCFVRDLQGNDLLTADAHVPSQQELDLLFGPLHDEFFNAGSNPQDKQPTMNIQSTLVPSTPTNVHAEENNDNQAEEGEQSQDDEFTNPFCEPTQEVAESSSHNIGNSNVSTFNQQQVSEYRWTKDHPLEQVRGNPSRPVQTRRQLATDPEMCMYALTVSTAEPTNIKEAMADSAWIEAMQKEVHQFDRLQDEDQTIIRNKARLVAKGTQVFSNLSDGRENGISQWSTKGGGLCCTTGRGFVDPDHPEKVYRLRKALYGLNQAPRAWYDELSKFRTSKGFTKGLQIHQSPCGIFINQAKYTLEILHKHGMDKGQSIGTPMAMKPKLDADLSGNLVDQTDYRSKIGSLMYLTSSRPEIVQALYADHAGCIDSRKSISGGIQFLGDKLVTWMSKKQKCTAMSSAETKYVALSARCAQVITEYQLADMFTKALPEDRFKYLVRRIGMRCLTPAELEVLAKESA
nr:hypothetical protein [Tanacetum cinerariifolium]